MTPANGDGVRLEVPADTRYLHVVRLATAGVGADAGLDVAEIDDLKIALDELCSTFMIGSDPRARIALDYRLVGPELVVEANRSGSTGPTEPDELLQTILDATVDEYEIVHDAQARADRFRITKRHRGD